MRHTTFFGIPSDYAGLSEMLLQLNHKIFLLESSLLNETDLVKIAGVHDQLYFMYLLKIKVKSRIDEHIDSVPESFVNNLKNCE